MNTHEPQQQGGPAIVTMLCRLQHSQKLKHPLREILNIPNGQSKHVCRTIKHSE
jgi:hypothetical protein